VLGRLEAEHDNLRAALQLVVEAGETEMSLRFGGALSHFWEVRGHHTEGRARLAALLELPGARAHPRLWAKVSCELGFLAADQGDYAEARALQEASLTAMRELGAKSGIARCLTGLAWIAIDEGDFATARGLHVESLEMGRELGDRRGIALGLAGLGRVATIQGDRTAARSYHEESLAIVRNLGDSRNIARSLMHLAWLAVDQQDLAGARERLAEALAIADELGDVRSLIDGIELSAYLAMALDRMGRAARLRGAAEARREASSVPLSSTERATDEIDIATIRAALGELGFEAAWAEGRAMTLEQAVAYVLEEQPPA
jgi:tetratricopeptide (TPR) repeat protein